MSPGAPLADAARAFLDADVVPFTVPGHKRRDGLGAGVLAHDLPLSAGADDLRLTGDLLGEAQRLAARFWGADRTWFSVQGSTHGNQALALAVGRPGERVIVARTLHKSLFNGLVLAGLVPVWVRPDVDPRTGLALGVPLARVEAALEVAPDARAVFLVEPSYVGAASDVRAIAERVHAAGMPLVVDQAWGGHFGLHPALPDHALALGADAFVTSVHKMLTAFTQGALVAARGDRLDLDRLDAAFELLHTTSPSAAILASIDGARHLAETRGADLLAHAIALADGARAQLSAIDGLAVSGPELAERHPSVAAVDPTRLVLSLAGTGADGFHVDADLHRRGLRLEMADRETLVPIVSLADDERSVARLVQELTRAIEERRGEPRAVSASAVWSVDPVVAMPPREAFFAPRARVAAAEAVGRVAAETAAPYPPGIPALAPGEVVTAEVLEALQLEAAAGSRIAYCGDPTLRTVAVVASG
jgi:lysine decarboxylase